MRNINTSILLASTVFTITITHAASSAHACGGVIEADTGTVAQTGQLGIISVDQGKTSVVLTLDVADASSNFGVLVPVPGEPTIDDQPVSTDLITQLELETRAQIGVADEDGDGGSIFACGGGDLSGGAPKSVANDVVTGDAVDIGPVTAQWVSGENGADVSSYLQQEGFVLPDGGQAIVDAYVGRGLSFLAFKRNETSTGPARVGVHFTLDGDRRAYALQMTKMGAAETMHFTILVATADADGVASDTPYTALTIDKLDRSLVGDDYSAAVSNAVEAVGGKAFVVETKILASDLGIDGLDAYIPEGNTITRMTSVMKTANLDADVTFTSKAPAELNDAAAFGGTSSSGPTLPPKLGDLALLLSLASLLVFVPRAIRSRKPTAAAPAYARASL